MNRSIPLSTLERHRPVHILVVVVVVVVVVVGTNKDWGPENKLSEPILEFAWCSLGASMEFSTVLKNNFG